MIHNVELCNETSCLPVDKLMDNSSKNRQSENIQALYDCTNYACTSFAEDWWYHKQCIVRIWTVVAMSRDIHTW